jgi:hypothetical protein
MLYCKNASNLSWNARRLIVSIGMLRWMLWGGSARRGRWGWTTPTNKLSGWMKYLWLRKINWGVSMTARKKCRPILRSLTSIDQSTIKLHLIIYTQLTSTIGSVRPTVAIAGTIPEPSLLSQESDPRDFQRWFLSQSNGLQIWMISFNSDNRTIT